MSALKETKADLFVELLRAKMTARRAKAAARRGELADSQSAPEGMTSAGDERQGRGPGEMNATARRGKRVLSSTVDEGNGERDCQGGESGENNGVECITIDGDDDVECIDLTGGEEETAAVGEGDEGLVYDDGDLTGNSATVHDEEDEIGAVPAAMGGLNIAVTSLRQLSNLDGGKRRTSGIGPSCLGAASVHGYGSGGVVDDCEDEVMVVPVAKSSTGMASVSRVGVVENEINGGGRSPKRRRKEEKEKRLASYRRAPTRPAQDRFDRAAEHRLYLVDKKTVDDEIRCAVIGRNGHLYNCCIGRAPRCNCSDFAKRKDTPKHGPCEHLIFIFIRVLKVGRGDHRWYQKCLVQSELAGLLQVAEQGIVPESGVMAVEAVRADYRKSLLQGDNKSIRRSLEGECTVCYDDLVPENGKMRPENVTAFCKKCGNNFHSACLNNWFRVQAHKTCPLCRAGMSDGEEQDDGAYLDLEENTDIDEQTVSLQELYAALIMPNRRGDRGIGSDAEDSDN